MGVIGVSSRMVCACPVVIKSAGISCAAAGGQVAQGLGEDSGHLVLLLCLKAVGFFFAIQMIL